MAPIPGGHQTFFWRPIDVYMKSGLHIDVHWTSKGHLMPTGNRCRQIRNFIQYRHFWNQWDVIIIDYDISLQQLLLCKNIVNSKECEAEIVKFYNRKRIIHQMGGYNWNCELTQYLSNTCQIHFIYATHGSK